MFDAALSPFLVGVHDDFGITASVKAMAAALELDAQRRKIIYLAVEDDSDIACFVVNGLVASGKIHDAEPAHTKDRSGAGEHSLVVRATTDERVHHFADAELGERAVRADYATDAAHRVISPLALRAGAPFAPRATVPFAAHAGIRPAPRWARSTIRHKAPPFRPEAAPSQVREPHPCNPASCAGASRHRSIDAKREPELRIGAR